MESRWFQVGNSNGMELDGMKDLLNKVQDLAKKVDEDLKDKALEAGAKVVKDAVEHHPNLPRSEFEKRHGADHVKIKKTKSGQYDIGFEDEFFYLIFTELGADGGLYKGTKKGINDDQWYLTPDIEKKPFLRPSFENNLEEVQKEMAKVIKKELGL